MIRRQFKEQYCHFRSFCSQDYQSIAAQKSTNPRPIKPIKVSLKVNPKITNRSISPSPTYQHRYTFSQNCPTVAESTKTLKPNIKFSWKKDLVQTTKKVGLIIDQLELKQLQLRQTRMVKLDQQLMIESKYAGQQHHSRVSHNHPTPEPKLEESLILVDYFNPSSQQMSRIESYLEANSR